MRASSFAIFPILLSIAGLKVYGDADGSELSDVRKHCGVYCAAVVNQQCGCDAITFRRMAELCRVERDGETTMLNVARALDACGVIVRVGKNSTPPTKLTIVQTRVTGSGEPIGHMMVVAPAEGSNVWIFSPPSSFSHDQWSTLSPTLEPLRIECEAASRPSTGILFLAGILGLAASWFLIARRRRACILPLLALVLIGCGQSRTDGPNVVEFLPSSFIDMGAVEPGFTRRTIQIVNNSDEAIRLSGYSSTCGCAVADFERAAIPAHQSLPINLTLQVASGAEKLAAYTFSFEGGRKEVVQVKATGISQEAAVKRRPNLDLGDVRIGILRSFNLEITVPRTSASLYDAKGLVTSTWKVPPQAEVRLLDHAVSYLEDEASLRASFSVTPISVGPGACKVQSIIAGNPFDFSVRWNVVVPADISRNFVTMERASDRHWAGSIIVSPSVGSDATQVLSAVCPGLDVRCVRVDPTDGHHVAWRIDVTSSAGDISSGTETWLSVQLGESAETAFALPIFYKE